MWQPVCRSLGGAAGTPVLRARGGVLPQPRPVGIPVGVGRRDWGARAGRSTPAPGGAGAETILAAKL